MFDIIVICLSLIEFFLFAFVPVGYWAEVAADTAVDFGFLVAFRHDGTLDDCADRGGGRNRKGRAADGNQTFGYIQTHPGADVD